MKSFFDFVKEQVEWAVEGGADYIIGETFDSFGEASIALKTIQHYGRGAYHDIKLQNSCYHQNLTHIRKLNVCPESLY